MHASDSRFSFNLNNGIYSVFQEFEPNFLTEYTGNFAANHIKRIITHCQIIH